MGLKSGSRDAGLDDDSGESGTQEVDETPSDDAGEQTPTETSGTDTSDGAESEEETNADAADGDGDRPAMSSIPYKLRRDRVNEGREQVPYFLREDVIAAEGDLQDALEDALGEKVYKSDYREAAMVVAQRNPDLIADVLREWGYDLE